MEDEPRFWPAQIDRHLQRVADEIGTHVLCHGEADDAPGGEVDHGREVGPALPAGDALPTGADTPLFELASDPERPHRSHGKPCGSR
jgi:hypothetical protein